MEDFNMIIENSELLTGDDKVFLIYLQRIIDNLNEMEYWLDKFGIEYK